MATAAMLTILTACGGRMDPQRGGLPPPSLATACPSDGQFDFSVRGAMMQAFEGRKVWVVAVERPDGTKPKRVVRLDQDVTRMANGEISSWDQTVAEAHTSVGDRASFDFCDFYFR